MKTIAGAILIHAAVVAICFGLTLGKGNTAEMVTCGMVGAFASLGLLIWGLASESMAKSASELTQAK